MEKRRVRLHTGRHDRAKLECPYCFIELDLKRGNEKMSYEGLNIQCTRCKQWPIIQNGILYKRGAKQWNSLKGLK